MSSRPDPDPAVLRQQLAEAARIADPSQRLAREYFLGSALADCGDEGARQEALALLRRLFDDGVVEAGVEAAAMLLTGGGGELDPNGGLALLAQAAGAGSSRGALLLGKLLLALRDRAADAIPWLQRAAAADEWEAHHLLGIAYFRGLGVAEDHAQARQHFRVAAEHGFVDAQFELSLMLLWGHGGPEDAAEARAWEERAADAGQPRACLNLGARYATHWDGHASDLERAAHWYERAAEAGSAEAARRLADLWSASSEDRADYWRARAELLEPDDDAGG